MISRSLFDEAFEAAASSHDYYFRNLGENKTINWSWTTGGVSGGNCWGEGGHYAMEGESAPTTTHFDNFLEQILPSITFIHYRRLVERVVKRDSRTVGEYYGNSTSYAYCYVTRDDLLEALIDLGYVA